MREEIITPPQASGLPFNVSLAGISYCDGSYRIKRPASPVTCVEYVISGCGVVHCNSQTVYPGEGDMYLLLANRDHLYYADRRDPWIKIWANISGDLPLHLLSAYGLARTILFEKRDGRERIQRIHEICGDPSKTPYEIQSACAGEFLGLVQFLAGEHSQRGICSEADIVKEYIDRNADRAVSLEEMAAQIAKSVSQTIRIFKKAQGITPYEYLLNQKLERAKLLLRSTNMSMKEIAAALSFADEHYFSGFFRKRIGITPGRYRYEDAFASRVQQDS